MRYWRAFPAILIVAAVTAFWLLRKTGTPGNTPAAVDSTTSPSIKTNAAASPRTKGAAADSSTTRPPDSANVPLQTAGENAPQNLPGTKLPPDPALEWKTPIAFYGKVVDQFDAPVTNAVVKFIWTTAGTRGARTEERTAMSAEEGRFAISGINGKRLGVAGSKAGFLPSTNSGLSFEYSDSTSQFFHSPNPGQPVVFRLQKLIGADPMYKFLPYGHLPVN